MAVVVIMIFGSCNSNDDGSYTPPITLYEKVNGSWTLTNLKMVDEFAKANGIEPNEQNIGSWFNYDTFQMNLEVNDQNEPTTYEVLGDVPLLFPPSGYWRLSTDFQLTTPHPAKIFLYDDAQRTQLLETLNVTSVPGSNNQMEVQLQRISGGAPFITYIFKLTSN